MNHYRTNVCNYHPGLEPELEPRSQLPVQPFALTNTIVSYWIPALVISEKNMCQLRC